MIIWSLQITDSEEVSKMTAVSETDSALAIKCLALCQALTDQGKAFNSLTICSTFSLSLDTNQAEGALRK